MSDAREDIHEFRPGERKTPALHGALVPQPNDADIGEPWNQRAECGREHVIEVLGLREQQARLGEELPPRPATHRQGRSATIVEGRQLDQRCGVCHATCTPRLITPA
jgi:hypothetical protein